MPEDRELRVVLLGLPGAGKSSSGNTILGPNTFKASCGFNTVSITAEKKCAIVMEREVKVVDTPGFSDEKLTPKKLFKSIMKSVLGLTRGPHAFIIVVRLGRVNRRDTKLLELMAKLFDEVASKFTMVLFTHGDDLREERIEDLIRENETMKVLIEKCNRRYAVFNNKSRDRLQVRELFMKIDDMVQKSGEDHCNSQIFKLTTADEIKQFFQELWMKMGSCFSCCAGENNSSDKELQPLFNVSN
ncbi:GTPase IMAP family member 9-like [Eucyclogobius newberryi]|uniref:GTPase IMAP family member 9-like n=1 Tax=Eucyclogobius newberryi TaxID=166745 RepID=UPI003B59FF83